MGMWYNESDNFEKCVKGCVPQCEIKMFKSTTD